MKNKKAEQIVYSINISDIQEVAEDVLNRRLTKREVDSVAKSLGDHIDWFQAVWNTILAEKIPE
jgi:hypothetical protein